MMNESKNWEKLLRDSGSFNHRVELTAFTLQLTRVVRLLPDRE